MVVTSDPLALVTTVFHRFYGAAGFSTLLELRFSRIRMLAGGPTFDLVGGVYRAGAPPFREGREPRTPTSGFHAA